jgi:drug/metabolite transporter (DMT)-like permease
MSLHGENRDESEPNITSSNPLISTSSLSKESIAKKKHWITHFSGILYAIFSSLLFTCSTFIIKELGVDLLDALLSRFVIQTVITLSFVLYKHYPLLGGTARQIVLQIICFSTAAVGSFLYFVALRYIELSDANTLAYTRVVWTVVLSVIVYRERPSIGTLIALPLTLLGVVFVTQPKFLFSSTLQSTINVDSKFRLLGFAMVLACALTSAANVLLFKQLISTSRDIKPSVLNLQFTFSVLIVLVLNILYKIFYVSTSISFTYMLSWRYLLSSAVSLISIGGTVLSQKAIKREHPAVFQLLGSADIIFALILQNIFTSVRSNIYALIGSALVIASVVLLGVSRIINERSAEKKLKQKPTETNEEKNGKA